MREATYDIEVYPEGDIGGWEQAKYLVHGFYDVLWTDDLVAALEFLKQSVERCELDWQEGKSRYNI